MKKTLIASLLALGLFGASATIVTSARAADAVVVDMLACQDENGGTATVPSGVPIDVFHFGWGLGTYGMVQNFLLKAITTETIIRNGTTTVNDLTGTYAIERLDRLFWVTRPTDTQLAPL